MQDNIYNEQVWVDRFISSKPADRYDRERIDRIVEMIPRDVETILDAGTGGGYVYRELKQNSAFQCFGIDISHKLVRRLMDDGVCVGDVRKLPFKDNEFDMVLAADLIEHIDEPFFIDSISEITRVAKRYVVINSPYKDAIDWPVSFCSRCGEEFNIYGHMRSVDMRLIKEFFLKDSGFKIVKAKVFGQKRDARPHLLVALARRLGKVYSEEGVVCPHCFDTSFGLLHRNFFNRFFGRMVGGIFFLMDRSTPRALKCGSEICVLLKKVRNEAYQNTMKRCHIDNLKSSLSMRRVWSHHFMPVYFQDRFIRDNLRYVKGDLLDLGCGDKPYEDLLKPIVKKHIGVDMYPGADAVMDAHKLSFDDESFDTVLALSIFEHCEDPFRVVSEAYRVLRKGGHLIASVPYIMFNHCHPRDFYRFTRYGLQYILKDFDAIKIENIGGYWTANGYLFLQYIARFLDKIKARFLLGAFCAALQPIFIMSDKVDKKNSDIMAQGYMAVVKKP